MNININNIMKHLFPFLVIIILGYGLNTILYFFLPKIQINNAKQESYDITYTKYQVYKSMKEKKIVQKKVQKVIKKEYTLISSIILKAIYSTSSNGGWIIIAERSSSNTHILSVGESFKNYTLKKVFKDYVIFSKNNKEYKLSMLNVKEKVSYTIKQVEDVEIVQDVEELDGGYNIKKELLNSYIKTPSKIWRAISIHEVYKDAKIDGFEIQRIAKNSVFAQLGLQKGDIIKTVNNIVLKSYADAFKIYKQIDKLKNLSMIILRDDTEMELEYEIK